MWFDSFSAPIKGVSDDVKRVSSLFKAPELACLEGLKSKIKSAYSLNRLRVVLLRHVALRVDGRCQANFPTFAGFRHSVVEYVIYYYSNLGSK